MGGSGTGTRVTGTSTAGGLVTAPAIEPVSLQEIKDHLRLDSDTFVGNVTLYKTIAAGSHVAAAGYSLVGTGVDVLGNQAIVFLQPVNNGASGTVDVKIQESDDNTTFTDWTGGAFTQVTESNDTTVQEIEYTGTKQYIRAVAKTQVATSEYGVSILVRDASSVEDNMLSAWITAAREQVEAITNRKLITQTWDIWFDEFPEEDFIKVPYGNLQSVTSVKYKDSDGTETTMTLTTDYLVDSSNEPGRIVLPYATSWPSVTYYPVNPVTIRIVCGYGTTSASVPAGIRAAIKMLVEDMYRNRMATHELINSGDVIENKTVKNLLYKYILWE